MEKRFRDYLRHLDKLDLDVMSEEEVSDEREVLLLNLTELHHEMIRLLIPMMAFFICACIFLAVGFTNFFIGSFIAAAVMVLVCVYFAFSYKSVGDMVKKLSAYIDKLTVR